IDDVALTDIVDRVLTVLDAAASSLSHVDDRRDAAASPTATPHVPRFEFVHKTELRPILEQAVLESRRAYEERSFGQALVLSCGILETLITDALEHAGLGPVDEWSFEARIAAAEHARLIRSGCARLPDVARRYRELADTDGTPRSGVSVSERDARL